MTNKPDGGCAFPYVCETYVPEPGMSLRDWFAGMALQGMLADGDHAEVLNEKMAEFAYHMADAMIEQREK